MKIANTTVKEPKSFEFELNDVDGESYRDDNGNLHRDRLAVKRTLKVSWGPLSTSEISTILSLVQAPSFKVKYLDALTGADREGTFYVGARTAPVYSYNQKFNKITWEGLSMDFIEY